MVPGCRGDITSSGQGARLAVDGVAVLGAEGVLFILELLEPFRVLIEVKRAAHEAVRRRVGARKHQEERVLRERPGHLSAQRRRGSAGCRGACMHCRCMRASCHLTSSDKAILSIVSCVCCTWRACCTPVHALYAVRAVRAVHTSKTVTASGAEGGVAAGGGALVGDRFAASLGLLCEGLIEAQHEAALAVKPARVVDDGLDLGVELGLNGLAGLHAPVEWGPRQPLLQPKILQPPPAAEHLHRLRAKVS